MTREFITYYCVVTPIGTKICKTITKYIPCEPSGEVMPSPSEYTFLDDTPVPQEDRLVIIPIKEVAKEMGLKISDETGKEFSDEKILSLFEEKIIQYTSEMYEDIIQESFSGKSRS